MNEKVRAYDLMRRYNLTIEEYESMLSEQAHVCAICDSEEPGGKPGIKRFIVDHCHNTTTIRGLLCNACNLGIGMFKDDHKILAKAVKYLERFSK